MSSCLIEGRVNSRDTPLPGLPHQNRNNGGGGVATQYLYKLVFRFDLVSTSELQRNPTPSHAPASGAKRLGIASAECNRRLLLAPGCDWIPSTCSSKPRSSATHAVSICITCRIGAADRQKLSLPRVSAQLRCRIVLDPGFTFPRTPAFP